MKIKLGIYFFLPLVVAFTSCVSSKKATYIQTERDPAKIVNIPSYRLENVVRFQPDDILGITVNVPGEQSVAQDYNLPLVPSANTENTGEGSSVDTGMGRQAFLVKKDGTIDFPVLGFIKVAGYTQSEMEDLLKELLKEHLNAPTVVTVRLLNFKITITGEVNSPGKYSVDRDQINLLEALALASDMTIYGRRDNVTLLRQQPDGAYKRVTLDISKENVISSPYFFLRQNDMIYVAPLKAKSQNADISPMFNTVLGSTTFAMSLVTFILMMMKK